jgi:hypothetical protein
LAGGLSWIRDEGEAQERAAKLGRPLMVDFFKEG